MVSKMQQRRGTAAEWSAANPVLADGELGVEKDTRLAKVGDGVTRWNVLPYFNPVAVPDVLNLAHQVNHPPTPGAGSMRLYARAVAGRMLARILGPAGIATPLQPSFFQNQIIMANPGGSTTIGTFGMTVTSVGVVSHPPATEQLGYAANLAGAATAGATAGTGNNGSPWSRGTIPGGSNGYFIAIRCAFPDTSYDAGAASTGSRLFVGLAVGSMASTVLADDLGSQAVGFQRLHTEPGTKDATWQVVTRDTTGGSQVRLDTGVPFAPGKVYDFYLFAPPVSNVINWRVDNISDGTSAEGVLTTALPAPGALMRAGLQVGTVDAVVRNVRLHRLYGESDR